MNPQYTYAWAVPFLCLYLLWRRLRYPNPSAPTPQLSTSLFLLSALLYAPTRLVQEANPEWRLVSWALALEVLTLTLLLLNLSGLPLSTLHSQLSTSHAPPSTLNSQLSTFPLAFFLVAVPWPTVLEAPLIKLLTRANAAGTVELLTLFGIPALQHGNTIEVGSGVVGIDDACSGIRSFQATLMISLFFGEFYRLRVGRRFGLCLLGFALSFLFNLGRTTLLSWVAAVKGIGAIAQWHDPAGITILVACFLSLWAGARTFLSAATPEREAPAPSPSLEERAGERRSFLSLGSWRGVSTSLLAWLLLVEIGTELWYRSHETHLPPPVTWTISPPRDNPGHLPFTDKTRQLLRYDEALNATWLADGGQRWQAIFLRWNPGRIAPYLARAHTPEVCLTAAGRELLSQSPLRIFLTHGLQLPFRAYAFRDAAAPLHVFYTLWEDRSPGQSFATTALNYQNRLAPVLAGRRNSGQRSLELAVWGIPDDSQAAAALQTQLDRIISGGPTTH